jgi:HK97 family phage prohead protease
MTIPQLTFRSFDNTNLRVAPDGDGLTVEGLVIPYGVTIEAVDLRESGVLRYFETFAPGSNGRAVRAPNRTILTYGHDESFPARLGVGATFQERDDGLWGSFRLDRSRADQAIDALTSSHINLSAGFLSLYPRAGTEQPGEKVLRRAVVLRHVAAVPVGQYAEARITAFRELDVDAELADDPTAAEVDAKRSADEALELVAWVDGEATRQAAWDAWAAGTGPRPNL